MGGEDPHEARPQKARLIALPEWFGITAASDEYIRSLPTLTTFLARLQGVEVGFIALEQHSPESVKAGRRRWGSAGVRDRRVCSFPALVTAILFTGILFFANFSEWAIHVRTLHRRVFPYAPFERHTQHHAFFGYETMAVDELAELFWVMFPPWALPLMIVSMLPIFALLHAVVSPNAAWIFLLGALVYYGTYEIFHSLAHLPETHAWAGIGWVRAISHHHRVHHDPRLMKRWNFNFAVPIFDRLFGTLYVAPLSREDLQ